ncbi:hypothetical protein [Corynebacterium bovis]|uniref:hypothetical protein n=1 Tax=Corynebacterium bovis TaxID=36808 RepID=UPI003138E2A0
MTTTDAEQTTTAGQVTGTVQATDRDDGRSATLYALLIADGKVVTVDTDDGTVHPVADSPNDAPDGVTVIDDTVYWTTMGTPSPAADGDTTGEPDFTARNGGLHAVAVTGGTPRDIVPAGGITTGKQLTTDGRGRLYWGDREGFRVSTCRLDGSDLRDLVVNEDHGDWTDQCVGVALDLDAGYLYWTQKGPAKGGRGRILRAPLDLPDGATADARPDIEVLWEGLPEPIDLEIADGYLYWTDRGAEPDGNTLNRAPLPAGGVGAGDGAGAGGAGAAGAGAGVAEPEILARGFHETIGLAVDRVARVAYVADLGGEIRRVPLDGSDQGVVIAALGSPVTGLALHRP